MKFLYKIHSGYDGFRPAVLPERIKDGKLKLGWRHYIDVVERGWECWVYFHGPHQFENGVYVKGVVADIDLAANEVYLRIRNFQTDQPITPHEVSEKVASVVSRRYRQVFLWPDEWMVPPICEPSSCRTRQCGDCETWKSLPLISLDECKFPNRLKWSKFEDVVPAHWVVPPRCYERSIREDVKEITRRFYDFKLGEMAYAYPFAMSIVKQLRSRNQLKFDYVVPIPLSPGKAKNGEKHRTRELAKEIGRLLDIRVRDMLSLTSSVSKRSMQKAGFTVVQFERKYRERLEARIPKNTNRLLLVDDVMTRGSTVAQVLDVILEESPETTVVVVTAGQMIVKDAVVNDRGFKAKVH